MIVRLINHLERMFDRYYNINTLIASKYYDISRYCGRCDNCMHSALIEHWRRTHWKVRYKVSHTLTTVVLVSNHLDGGDECVILLYDDHAKITDSGNHGLFDSGNYVVLFSDPNCLSEIDAKIVEFVGDPRTTRAAFRYLLGVGCFALIVAVMYCVAAVYYGVDFRVVHHNNRYYYLKLKSIYIISLTFLDTYIITEQFDGVNNHNRKYIEYVDPQLFDKLTQEIDKSYLML